MHHLLKPLEGAELKVNLGGISIITFQLKHVH